MADTLAMFGGHSSTVFKALQRNYTNNASVKPFVQECADALKNNDVAFDLMKALEKGSITEAESENAQIAYPVVTISHLSNFMVYAKNNKKSVAEAAKAFGAFMGDRPGMIASAAISASNNDEDFKQHCKNALKAAIVASKGAEDAKDLLAKWSKEGVSFPSGSALNVPLFSPCGAGDIRKSTPDFATGLALVLCVKDPQVPKEVTEASKQTKREAKTVHDFGCPPSATGKLALPVDGIRDQAALDEALPDVAEIKRAIKKAGFSYDVNLFLSFAWLFHDLALNAAVIYGFYLLMSFVNNFWLKWLVMWPIYSLVVGTTLTGVWVLGHECGHRAFAGTGANNWINDVVGFVTHTPLLVPFWAWRYSHHKHHMFTNHLLDGETHVPNHRNGAKLDHSIYHAIGEDAFVFVNAFIHLVLGWPMYLVNNATGGRRTPQGEKIDRKKPLSHFKPSSQIFEDNQRAMILPGTIGCVVFIVAVCYLDVLYGMGTSLFYYWGAYLVTNGWLVLYTWLHHTDADIPHFSDGHFSYMRGATCSIDRSYPWWINYVHHHIGSTHVMHHISFQVPHYRAENATKVYREKYPHLYRYDNRTIWNAVKEISAACHYVDDVQGVQYYKPVTELPKDHFKRSKKSKTA